MSTISIIIEPRPSAYLLWVNGAMVRKYPRRSLPRAIEDAYTIAEVLTGLGYQAPIEKPATAHVPRNTPPLPLDPFELCLTKRIKQTKRAMVARDKHERRMHKAREALDDEMIYRQYELHAVYDTLRYLLKEYRETSPRARASRP